MATLIEGQQYGLTSQVNHCPNQTLIFVKLTDSALRSIEQYINSQALNSSNFKPSIQFNPNTTQGVISLPIRSNEHDEKQRFSFSLSTIETEGPQGSFECVRQSRNKTLDTYGSMHYKLQIHASEDSYQKTKVKMAVVEQENKKNCTKVIKASGPNVGRKVKVNKRNFEKNSSVTKKTKLNDNNNVQTVKSLSSSLISNNNNNTNTNTNMKNTSNNKPKSKCYNDLLNVWANKPSSPEVNSTNHQNVSIAGISHYNSSDLKSTDKKIQNNNLSPESNASIVSHEQFSTHHHDNRVNNYLSSKDFDRKNTGNINNSIKTTFRYAKTNGHHLNSSGPGSINSTPNSSPDSGTGSNDGSVKSSYSNASDVSDYIMKYVPITNDDQRSKYKADFYHEYEEYRRLHRLIEDVAHKFSELEIRLNTKTEGSEEWNILMEQIVKEYEETKNNLNFQQAKNRLLYLHDKLAHIKRLVVDFDMKHPKRISNRIGVQQPILS